MMEDEAKRTIVKWMQEVAEALYQQRLDIDLLSARIHSLEKQMEKNDEKSTYNTDFDPIPGKLYSRRGFDS